MALRLSASAPSETSAQTGRPTKWTALLPLLVTRFLEASRGVRSFSNESASCSVTTVVPILTPLRRNRTSLRHPRGAVKSRRPRARERQQGMGTRGAKWGDLEFEELLPEVCLAEPGASYTSLNLNGLPGLDRAPEARVRCAALRAGRR